MNFQFQNRSKFALLTINNVYANLPSTPFQLSDGAWVTPGLPMGKPDLERWENWIGSIRMESLRRANLVLLVEEPSNNPGIVDAAHRRLGYDLNLLFYLLHLKSGIEHTKGADLLYGYSDEGPPVIRQMIEMPAFYQIKGYRRSPITQDWLEDTLVLRAGVMDMKMDNTAFRRVTRGLHTLFSGLMNEHGQDRLHQFVRSLEALILPDKGKTTKQFARRCQTFTGASEYARERLEEAFEMRSATEHLNEWDEAVQAYPAEQRENVCLHRTRQIERLACHAYARLLSDAALRDYFRTEATIRDFWKLPDDQRLRLWGAPFDIAQEPFVEKYDSWERAFPEP